MQKIGEKCEFFSIYLSFWTQQYENSLFCVLFSLFSGKSSDFFYQNRVNLPKNQVNSCIANHYIQRTVLLILYLQDMLESTAEFRLSHSAPGSPQNFLRSSSRIIEPKFLSTDTTWFIEPIGVFSNSKYRSWRDCFFCNSS